MKERRNAIIKFCLYLGVLLVSYIPTIVWMVDRWEAKESYYGHGWLIPIVSLYIVWQRRPLLKRAKISPDVTGLFIVLVSLGAHIAAASLRIYFLSGFSLVTAIWGLILFSFGRQMMKNLIFPVFFLAAMIPLPLVMISNLTVRLKLMVAQVATVILNWIGFHSVRSGSLITMPNSEIEIAAPCSGLRSLISLLTLGLIFAFALKISLFKKIVLFLSSIPIAIVANIIRVLLLAVVNDIYGEKIAMGFFHDCTGFVMFAVAFIGLYFVGVWLEGTAGEKA